MRIPLKGLTRLSTLAKNTTWAMMDDERTIFIRSEMPPGSPGRVMTLYSATTDGFSPPRGCMVLLRHLGLPCISFRRARQLCWQGWQILRIAQQVRLQVPFILPINI